MEWKELVVHTTTEGSDLAANILYEAGATGVVVEDPQDIIDLMRRENDWDYIDPGVLYSRKDGAMIKAYLPLDQGLDQKLAAVERKLEALRRDGKDFGSLRLVTRQVDDQKWQQNWKKYYKPVRIGQNIVIKPWWEDYSPRDEDIVVTLDPGNAFGTGTHESTALCIELVEKYMDRGCRVLDIGCGSGILAITAAKLGARPVEAYDTDSVAVKATRRNAALNRMEEIIRVEEANLLDKARGRAHMIVANIVADVIIKMCPSVGERLLPQGIFITSGIVDQRFRDVENVFETYGLEIVDRLNRGSWVALAARVRGN